MGAILQLHPPKFGKKNVKVFVLFYNYTFTPTERKSYVVNYENPSEKLGSTVKIYHSRYNPNS